MKRFFRRMDYLLHRRRYEQDLARELEFHQSMMQQETRREFGNATLAREDARAVWIWPWLESVTQDVRYALRGLRRQPGFALIAIVALAFGIGLNTSLFTVFNAVALRPWPVKDPGRVVKIFGWTKNPPAHFDNVRGFSVAEFRYLAEHTKSMAGLLATRGEGAVRSELGRVRLEGVTGAYFRVLGINMEFGRGFLSTEDRIEAPEAVAVISHAAWQSRFGGDPSIIGRRVRFEDTPYTIVGVAPAEFTGTSPESTPDAWIPLASVSLLRPQSFLKNHDACCIDVAGRLAPGMSREQARAELAVLSADFWRQSGARNNDGVVLAGTPFLQRPGRKVRQLYAIFGLMSAGVLLVLALACANVGNLLLARAAARRREIGARLSLGAGRWRIVRQLLTESLVVAMLATVLGLALAWSLPGAIFRSVAGEVSFRLQPDLTVLVFSAVTAILACLLFGLAPALHATSDRLADALKERAADSNARLPLRSFLLSVQVSVSVVLLVSAGLLLRAIQHARYSDPGFTVRERASIAFEFPSNAYTAERQRAFFATLSNGLDRIDGARPFGFSWSEPLGPSRTFNGFRPRVGAETAVLANAVSAGYFDVLHIPVIAGRNFLPADSGRDVVLINQAMADRYFPGENPLGKNIDLSKSYQIIGIVANARTWSLDAIEPTVFTPVAFQNVPKLILRDSPANIEALSALVKNLDGRVEMRVTRLEQNLERSLNDSRMGAMIAGMLGIVALALAAIGVAGVFAYAVQQRTREIGIRVALGAQSRQVVRTVIGYAARSLGFGLVAGMGLAAFASRFMRQYLFGLSALDPATYAAVLVILTLAGVVATAIPLRRAIKLDPIRALHHE